MGLFLNYEVMRSQPDTERRGWEDEGRNWSDVATSQGIRGMPTATRSLGARKDSPLDSAEGVQHDYA